MNFNLSNDKIPSKADREIEEIPNVTATPTTNTSPNNIVKLAAFNIQNFNSTKKAKPEVNTEMWGICY